MHSKLIIILFCLTLFSATYNIALSQEKPNDFFIQNSGKILFSKLPFNPVQNKDNNFINKFQSSDFIYGTILLKDSLKNISPDNYEFTETIYIDGGIKLNFKINFTDSLKFSNYFPLEILPEPTISKSNEASYIAHSLSQLTNEKHKIKILFKNIKTSNIFAQGEFELDCANGLEKIEIIANTLTEKKFANVEMAEPKMKNTELEKEMLDCFSDWIDKPVKLVITDYDWIYVRDKWQLMQYRYINTEVAVKNKYGKCKLINVSFKQKFKEVDFGKTERFAVGSSKEILCDKIK
ncbi:MAG: hypothetical protein ABSG15_09680 [FCB group bacterium]|jgi:hypothetical protein